MIPYLTTLMAILVVTLSCDGCYQPNLNENCRSDTQSLPSTTLHMSVHPHLDAFWIFDFESYYNPQPNQGDVWGYFRQNRFDPVKEIFNTALNILSKSKKLRQTENNLSQAAHRSFMNSQMGFFKRWYSELTPQQQQQTKSILKTKYWQILGGGYVQHDQGCSYYDDIIQNFQLGLHFLKEQFNYYPKVAISADSFGHSQSTLAILAHLGIQGYFVQRSDQHILLQNKTQFIWKAKSTNGRSYGALPTHIRWAIHGFQDQFIGADINQDFCHSKQSYMNNLRNENNFLKRILKSTHIMRYFGHDFQKFDNYSYTVIQSMMKKFSMEKCNKVAAVYGNPTQYFITLMKQVYGEKIKPVVTRSQDIFPIWDYDSGLYWTGYFTTDAYHKKNYRDIGRYLRGVRKMFLPLYLNNPKASQNVKRYQKLQEMAEQVTYLTHHDGISGTSKYTVMDKLQMQNQKLLNQVQKQVVNQVFNTQFPVQSKNYLFTCHMGDICKIPANTKGDIYLKVINTDGNPQRDPLIVQLPIDQYYTTDSQYQINCFCYELSCPCRMYLYKPLYPYTAIRLTKAINPSQLTINRMSTMPDNPTFHHNNTHLIINHQQKDYAIGYKSVKAMPTQRNYKHLSRYGDGYQRGFQIRPGKYALGNDPNQIKDCSSIRSVQWMKSTRYTFLLVHWKRHHMTTLISIPASRPNQWKIQTITATPSYQTQDIYFQVITPIVNNNRFVTDSNGWLTLPRQLFKHQDYQAHFSTQKYDDLDGNTYPITAFAYIYSMNNKVSINVERPQGAVAYRPGTLWVNFDRLSQDDGKWVYQNAYRSEYQKYTHIVTVNNKDYNQRKIQRRYDQPIFVQGIELPSNTKVENIQTDFIVRNQWNKVSNIQSLKFMVRPFNDTTTVLRVFNMHDQQQIRVGLFAEKNSPLLTTYYGRTASFQSIVQTSLGANMNYSTFINKKWNWKQVVDLQPQNRIFNKQFRQNITLLPLQIRTFLITNLNFDKECIKPQQLKYNKQEIRYKLNVDKAMPQRQPIAVAIEKEVVDYLLNGDHCKGVSPVVAKTNISAQTKQQSHNDVVFQYTTATQQQINAQSYLPQAPQLTPQRTGPPLPNNTPKQQQHNIRVQTQQQPKTHQKININSVTQLPSAPVPLLPSSDNIVLKQIEQKIKLLKALTSGQKQMYFKQKLQTIRQWKLSKK